MPLLILQPVHAADYHIVSIAQQSTFAGRLGQRVRETLTVEAGGKTYTIHLRGDYHTRMTRDSQRLHKGDEIRLPHALQSSEATLDRTSIKLIRL